MKTAILILALLAPDELSDAADKLKEGYTFTVEAKNETIPAREPALSIEGAWAKEGPLRAKSGDYEMFRGQVLVWRTKDGEWKRFDPRAGMRMDEQTRYSLFQQVLRLRLPHEEIAAVAKGMKNAKKGKDGTIEGDLPAEVCVDILGEGNAGPVQAGRGNYSGTATFRIEKGAVANLEIAITWTETYRSHVGEHTTKVTWRKTTTIAEVGAKVELPEGAKKLLE